MDFPTSTGSRRVDLTDEPPFELGRAKIDPPAHEITIGGLSERLQPQPLKVLIALRDKSGLVVTRDELIDRCWDGRVVGEDVLNRCVSVLRRVAERGGGFKIETVPKAGYRLLEECAELPPESDAASRPRRLMNYRWPVAGTLLACVAGAAFLLMRSTAQHAAEPVKPTIILLPFTSTAGDPQLREVASETRDSLAQTFARSGMSLRLLDQAPADDRNAPNLVMSGDFSKSGGEVAASVRLNEDPQNATVFSHQFLASGADVRVLPERIGAQLAGDLTWAAPLMVLDPRNRLEPSDLADLLGGYDFAAVDELTAYQNAIRIAAKVPNVRIAQIIAAFDTAFVLDQIPREDRAEAVQSARAAAQRALKLGADFGDTYATWCLLHSDALMEQCEQQLKAGRRADADAPFLNSFLSRLMRNVGRFKEADEFVRLTYTHDPYVPTKIGWMLLASEYDGEHEDAKRLYEQGIRWWPEFAQFFFINRLKGMLERGDFDAIGELEKEVGKSGLPQGYRESGALRMNWKREASVAPFCSATKPLYVRIRCLLVLSRFGDQNGAYAIADKIYSRRLGRTPVDTETIWLNDPGGGGLTEFVTSPAAAKFRADPRFEPLAERTGLLAYWHSTAPPDFCQNTREPECSKLLH